MERWSPPRAGAGCLVVRTRLLALIAVLLAGCSTASGPGGLGEIERAYLVSVVSWDMNRDGTVTCDEWKAYARQAFSEADANRDGKLTTAEFETLVKSDRLFFYANFAYFDANRDGFVDVREFVDKPNPAFTYLDNDKTAHARQDRPHAPADASATGDGLVGGQGRR